MATLTSTWTFYPFLWSSYYPAPRSFLQVLEVQRPEADSPGQSKPQLLGFISIEIRT